MTTPQTDKKKKPADAAPPAADEEEIDIATEDGDGDVVSGSGDGLDEMDEEVDWEKEKEGGGERSKLDDGEYVFECTGTRLDRSKTTKKNRFVWELKVATGPCAGRRAWKENILEPDKAKWLKGDLKAAGVELHKAVELREKRHELHGRFLKCKLDTVNDYQRIYVNGVVDPDDLEDAVGSVIDDPADEATEEVDAGAGDVVVVDDDDETPF